MKLPRRPRQPFLGLVLAAGAGILLADFCPLPARAIIPGVTVLGVAAIAFLWRPRLLPTLILVSGIFVMLHTLQTVETPGRRLEARLGDRPRAVNVRGCVVTEPKVSPSGVATFLFQLNAIELEDTREPTRATVLVRWKGNPAFGDELRLSNGTAEQIQSPRNPGEFDMRSYLARQDIFRMLFVRYAEDGVVVRHGGGNPILRVAHRSRMWMQRTICSGLDDSPEVQNFLSGLVLGLRHQTADDIEEPFQQTGTLHLFAVAGLHVGIVATLLLIVASVARLPGKWTATVIIPLILFYAAVTGLHISSVRAALMSAVLLGAVFFERQNLRLNSLAAAAFLLFCWNTQEIFSAGFQLSFAVVGAIILLADPVAHIFHRWTAPDPFLPRTLLRGPRKLFRKGLHWLGEATSVSVAAWVGSVVLILWYFYLITPISLLANLVVVPIAFFIVAVALLSIVTAPVSPWLSLVFNNANYVLVSFVLGLVHLFARIPAGHSYFAHPHWIDGTQVKINVLDVGTGAAVHLQTRKADWLFDCGSERDYDRVLRPYLHAAGVNHLNGLLLSHGDSMHIGGASDLVNDSPPTLLIDNPAIDRSAVHRRLRALFLNRRLKTEQPAAGHRFNISRDVAATILFPFHGLPAAAADDQALVVQLQLPAGRLLLMSDSGIATEKALLAGEADLRSDILVKGQNHSSPSGSEAFLDAVRPVLIVATSRDFPKSERIDDEWVDRVRARQIKLMRQDETGAVELRFRKNSWEARAYVTGETFRSASR